MANIINTSDSYYHSAADGINQPWLKASPLDLRARVRVRSFEQNSNPTFQIDLHRTAHVHRVDVVWARPHTWAHRFGTLQVSLSSANDASVHPASSLTKTRMEMDSGGRVRFVWCEQVPPATRFIKVQQMEATSGGGDGFRGLEIAAVEVYSSISGWPDYGKGRK